MGSWPLKSFQLVGEGWLVELPWGTGVLLGHRAAGHGEAGSDQRQLVVSLGTSQGLSFICQLGLISCPVASTCQETS